MKITHIYHSGFLVELEHTLLLFDYYKGSLPALPPEKELYVFVSHKHGDHYSPVIYKLAHPNIHYVLFEDVPAPTGCEALWVGCRECYTLDGLSIETLRSTDEGCAFLVTAEGKCIYHAGDLNWWHWEGEPDADNSWHKEAFAQELALLEGRRFDAAFVPLDPRQEQNAWWGFEAFLKACTCSHVFPMHYGDDRAAMLAYLSEPPLNNYAARILPQPVWQEP